MGEGCPPPTHGGILPHPKHRKRFLTRRVRIRPITAR